MVSPIDSADHSLRKAPEKASLGSWKRRWLNATLLSLAVVAGAPLTALEIEWAELSDRAAGGAKGAVQLACGAILNTRERHQEGEHQVVCTRSLDSGKSWEELAVIARQRGHATVGDGHLLQLPSGEILFSYRHNLLGESDGDKRHYSIRVAVSRDDGQSWAPHSTVATSSHEPEREPEALRGLWSSFLLLTRNGELQCYYDDEDMPHREGFVRHQWLTMRTWEAESKSWRNPVTVARAHNPAHLSREGMPSVVELASGTLLCVFESVRAEPPHANIIRSTTSDDGGRTWSWQREKRGIVFQAGGGKHLAISPWVTALGSGELICIFATDEDREVPGISGTPPHLLYCDIKYVFSRDGGNRWSYPAGVAFAESNKNYVPGLLELRDGSLLAMFWDFATGTHRAVRGILPERTD